MKNFTLLLLAFTLCTGTGYAQRTTMKVKRTAKTEIAQNHDFNPVLKLRPSTKKNATMQTSSEEDATKLWEDFSKFTAGSEDNPDTTPVTDSNGTIDDSYTLQPGWSGGGVYQAGGTAYIGMYQGETGYLTTPVVDVSDNDGMFRISFRAKSLLSDGDQLTFLHLCTEDMFSMSSMTFILTNEWKAYSTTLTLGTANDYFQMWTNNGEWLVDDIKIESGGTPAPVILPATNFTGTSFTANWEPVDGAVEYLLSVFYEDSEQGSYVYVMQNQTVEGTSYDVTGLEPNVTYFYTVQGRMADGTFTTLSSPMAALPTVEAPEAFEATNVTSTGFTANWSAVDFGQIYVPYLYKEHTASVNETYTFIDTDFSSIESTGTFETPENLYQGYSLDGASGAYGWYISMAALMSGGIGIDNSYSSFYGPGFMYSPAMDLTYDGGKVSMDITYASADASTLVMSLATVDEDNYLVEIEPVELPVTSVMTQYHVTLEGGTDNCYIVIYALDGTNVMIDDMKVSVSLKEGESFEHQINSNVVSDGSTSSPFEGLKAAQGERYAYDVMAVYYGDGYNTVSSALSNRVYVDLNSGVQTENADLRNAYMENGVLKIANPYGEEVTVCNAAGMTVWSDNSGSPVMERQLDEYGVYLVRIGSKTFKVVR